MNRFVTRATYLWLYLGNRLGEVTSVRDRPILRLIRSLSCLALVGLVFTGFFLTTSAADAPALLAPDALRRSGSTP
jgi:hypothetical protein